MKVLEDMRTWISMVGEGVRQAMVSWWIHGIMRQNPSRGRASNGRIGSGRGSSQAGFKEAGSISRCVQSRGIEFQDMCVWGDIIEE